MALREVPRRPRPSRKFFILALLFVVLIGARSIASYTIEYEWWKELGQVSTWTSMLLYGFGPSVIATLIVFIVLWIGHARGMKASHALRIFA